MGVDDLQVALAAQARPRLRRPLLHDGRAEAGVDEDVGHGEAGGGERVVVEVEPGPEAHALPGGPVVDVAHAVGRAHVGVVRELRLRGPARVMAVRGLQDPLAVALGIEGRGQARDEHAAAGRDDAGLRRVRGVALVAATQVEAPVVVELPPVVQEQGERVEVDLRAADRDPVVDRGEAGLEVRDHATARIDLRHSPHHHRIRVEAEAGGGLRVPARARRGVVLPSQLQVVTPGPARAEEVRQGARVLLVVAVLGVVGVEVRRVEETAGRDAGAAEGEEGRVVDVRARAPRVAEAERLPRELGFHEEARGEDAVVVGHEQVVGKLPVDEPAQVDLGRHVERGVVVLGRGVADVVRLDRVVGVDGAGQLGFHAVVDRAEVVGQAQVARRARLGRGLAPSGQEEPEAILHDGSAQRGLVELAEVARVRLGAGDVGRDLRLLEPRLVLPGRVREVGAEAARELVATTLGDGIDDAAGESAVLGGDAVGQHLHLLERILDEEVVRGAEEVVVDVDPVEEERVVVCEPTRDGELADVGRPVAVTQSGSERGDPLDRARGSQLVDRLRPQVLPHLGRAQDRRRFGQDLDLLLHVGHGHGGAEFGGDAEGDLDLALQGAEAREREGRAVLAGGQAPEDVAAGSVGDGGPLALQGGRLEGDGHPGESRTIGGFHASGQGRDLRALGRRHRRKGEDEGQCQCEDRAARAANPVCLETHSFILPGEIHGTTA